jgi:hypothetical protein
VLFAASWTRYLYHVSDAESEQIPFSLLFFELSDGLQCVLQLHVNDADVLVIQGILGRASDNHRSARVVMPDAVAHGCG